MLSSLLPLLGAFTILTSPQPPGAKDPAAMVCPAEEELSRFPVTNFVSAPAMADARQRAHVEGAAAEAVRLLVDSTDARVCARLLGRVERRVREEGGNLARVKPVMYQAGDFYYVVLALERHRSTRPGIVYIDNRWMSMFVFDRALNLLQAVAV